MIDKRGKKYYPVCDGCGNELPYCDTWSEARDAMDNAGWEYDHKFDTNLCPACQEENE